MKVVIVSSEVAPFSKTGGLGDVAGALGPALVRRGHRVITVSPRYNSIDLSAIDAVDTGFTVGLHAGGWVHGVRFWRVSREGVDHLLIDHPMYHRNGIYGDASGSFGDNHIRFAVMCRAALEAARRIPLTDGAPLGEDVVFHAHDWPAALLPVYLEALYRPLGLFAWAPSVLTIHNLAHQGRLPAELFRDLDLSPRWFSPEGLEWYGDIGLLKGGLLSADQLTTVSPNYAREILLADHGFGLDSVLRHRMRDLTGIVNGIDAQIWNPSDDPMLPAAFDPDNLSGKAKCKAALQADLGLPVDPRVPLVGAVGRLDPQKGVELLIEAIPTLVRETGAQFAILGSAAAAHAGLEHRLRELQHVFPRNVVAWLGFSEKVAHRIEAGADLFAMPSLFEPCGLNQMYSLRYGAVPVVRATGGLVDTVEQVDMQKGTGTGFLFHLFDGRAFTDTLRHALWVWREHPDAFEKIRKRAMSRDFSWGAVIPRYEDIYARASALRGLPIHPTAPKPDG